MRRGVKHLSFKIQFLRTNNWPDILGKVNFLKVFDKESVEKLKLVTINKGKTGKSPVYAMTVFNN